MTVLPERLVLQDIIVLLTVPAVNARPAIKMKLKIPVRALPVRLPKIAPTAAQATQLPQAAARAYVQSASHTRIITPARADISPAPAAPDIPNQEQHQGNVLAGKHPVLVISARLTRTAIPARADISPAPAVSDIV